MKCPNCLRAGRPRVTNPMAGCRMEEYLMAGYPMGDYRREVSRTGAIPQEPYF